MDGKPDGPPVLHVPSILFFYVDVCKQLKFL